MYSPYKSKSVNLSKQDIKQIPFDELAHKCVEAAKSAVADAQTKLADAFSHNQERYVAKMAETLGRSLETREGIEESIRETLSDVQPSLAKEDATRIRREAYQRTCTAFCNEYTLKARYSWLPAQLMATIQSWKAVKEKDSDTFSPPLTLSASLGSASDWIKGTYYFMMFAKRGDFLETQYKDPSNYYCALVPLILAGFKKYKGIQYSQWSLESLEKIVDHNLYEAMTYDVPDDLSKEDILAIRDIGLTIKTGKDMGCLRNPLSTYKLAGISHTKLGDAPWLAAVMLAQIWCAHPTNRNNYMILDPMNWDNTPAPLLSYTVLVKGKFGSTLVPDTNVVTPNPWDE